jgi:hypothetical protein
VYNFVSPGTIYKCKCFVLLSVRVWNQQNCLKSAELFEISRTVWHRG